MAHFSNMPLADRDEAMLRLFTERNVLNSSDLPVKSILNYWSETTLECHCFPIFTTDSPIDILHRYSDIFPREYAELVKEVKDLNANLHNDNGMSKEKLNMAKLKIPIIVYRALTELDPNFWDGDKGVKWLENNIKPIRVGHVRTKSSEHQYFT
jgi:hypothetical protein